MGVITEVGNESIPQVYINYVVSYGIKITDNPYGGSSTYDISGQFPHLEPLEGYNTHSHITIYFLNEDPLSATSKCNFDLSKFFFLIFSVSMRKM